MERRRRHRPGDHLSDELVIDLRLADGDCDHLFDGIVVVVEPVYAVVAIAAALDSGWDSVEIAQLAAAPDAVPIPLVSFEQPAPTGGASGRCIVRSDDLDLTLDRVLLGEESGEVMLAAPANARPAASAIARAVGSSQRVTFVPAAHEVEVETEPMTLDGMWACGMLIRILLEELDDARATRLTDAAGIAVSIAQGAEDVAAQLAAGVRWRDHLAAGGHPDDLRVASAVDSVGVVPLVTGHAEAFVARAWDPSRSPVLGSP